MRSELVKSREIGLMHEFRFVKSLYRPQMEMSKKFPGRDRFRRVRINFNHCVADARRRVKLVVTDQFRPHAILWSRLKSISVAIPK